MNPDNISPHADGYFYDDSILIKVPSLFVFLACIYLVMQLVGCCILFSPPKRATEFIFDEGQFLLSLSQEDDGESNSRVVNALEVDSSSYEADYSSLPQQEVSADSLHSRSITKSQKEFSYMEALKTREFMMMWWMFAFSTQSVQFINTMYKAYGQMFIFDDLFLASVGSVASIFNASGRLFWGYLMDRTSFKFCTNLVSSLTIFFMLTFDLSSYYQSKTLFSIWVVTVFFLFSGNFVIFPTATAQIFGRTNAGTIYGFLFTAPVSIHSASSI